jgi:hypothetical protein
MKIRKVKKEFKKGIRPIRKNRSYKVAKRLRKLWGGYRSFSDTISYSLDIWQGKAFLPFMLTISIGKKQRKAYFSTNSPLFNQKH